MNRGLHEGGVEREIIENHLMAHDSGRKDWRFGR